MAALRGNVTRRERPDEVPDEVVDPSRAAVLLVVTT